MMHTVGNKLKHLVRLGNSRNKSAAVSEVL